MEAPIRQVPGLGKIPLPMERRTDGPFAKTVTAPDSPSTFRLLCLLEETDKLLGKVASACLKAHLTRGMPGQQ